MTDVKEAKIYSSTGLVETKIDKQTRTKTLEKNKQTINDFCKSENSTFWSGVF